MPASTVVVVLTTLPSGADAVAFGRRSSRSGWPPASAWRAKSSIYRWKDAIEAARSGSCSSRPSGSRPLKNRLATLHPYDIPEFLVLPVSDGGDAYLAWVRDSTTG